MRLRRGELRRPARQLEGDPGEARSGRGARAVELPAPVPARDEQDDREDGSAGGTEPSYTGCALELEVTDTGTGHGPVRAGGHGLIGMRERAALFNGELTTGPSEGGGFAVRASLPLPAETRAPA